MTKTITLDLLEREGLVSSVVMKSEWYDDPLGFRAYMSHFSVREVLLAYGSPSRIWLQSASSYFEEPPPERIGYALWLYYDTAGFLLRYWGMVSYESVYRMCPSFEEDGDMVAMDLYLQSPDSQTPLERLTDLRPEHKDYIRPIEDAAGLSPQQFYDLFAGDNGEACFETQRDIWP